MNTPHLHYRANLGDKDTRSETIEHDDNHIYFYADVDSEHALALIRTVRKIDVRLRTEHLTQVDDGLPQRPIWLHVHSPGGDLFAGFSLADQLAAVQSPIYSVVEGLSASAATLISMACTRRYILSNSFMLVHQLSSFMWGSHEQFRDEMSMQTKAMSRLVQFYIKRSRLSEDEIRTRLVRDYWIDAETAVNEGFADEILR
jgi:ATP-dependent protease ClpP protease subunit